jgi:hypothetical protein
LKTSPPEESPIRIDRFVKASDASLDMTDEVHNPSAKISEIGDSARWA